jgi:hypothetical protein
MPGVKPRQAAFIPTDLVAGCQWMTGLTEGLYAPRDLVSRAYPTTILGAPAWTGTRFGPAATTFGTSAYWEWTPATQILENVYPCWVAALYTNTGTTQQALISQSNAGVSAQFAELVLNSGGTSGLIGYFVENNATTTASAITSGPDGRATDGLPHVLMGVAYSTSSRKAFIDGVQAASTAGTAATFTFNNLTMGVVHRSTVANPATTANIIWGAMGSGAVPDPMALARDLLTGRFSMLRRRSRRRVFGVSSGVSFFPWLQGDQIQEFYG